MKNLTYFFLACLFCLSLSNCGGNAPVQNTSTESATTDSGQSNVQDNDSQKDVVKVAVGSPDHTTLVTAVKAAGLVDELSNAGPFTVFAPTNAAFNLLPAGTVEGLLKPEKLADLQNILVAFVFNGLSASTSKVLVGCGVGDYTWQFYVTLYGVGFLITLVASLWMGDVPTRREIGTGAIMAVCSITGNVLLTLALSHGVQGAVAFPSANGGSLTLVVLAGVLFFKERIHPIGRLGIACGIAAILLLVMEPTLLSLLQNRS